MEKIRDVRDFVAGGDERPVGFAFRSGLGEADGDDESVADAMATFGFIRRAAFANKIIHGFGRTAIAECAVRSADQLELIAQRLPRRPCRDRTTEMVTAQLVQAWVLNQSSPYR